VLSHESGFLNDFAVPILITISHNVCDAVECPRQVKTQIKTLSVEQMQQFKKSMEEYRVPNTKLETRHHPLYPAFLLQMTTGLRRGELLGLTWENIHLDEGYISINQHLVVTTKGAMIETPKTLSSMRDIPLTSAVIELLRKHKGQNTQGFAFTIDEGNYIHPRSYQRTFDMLLKEAKLPKIRIHDLRHGFATTMLGNGVDLATTSLMLGHSDPKFTAKVYVHPTMEMKSKAMAKMSDIMNPIK